jgi:hypothetical protein
MGHERIGFLPKTQIWRHIVDQLSHFNNSDADVSQIANSTLNNIRKTYEGMSNDDSVIKAIQYLTILTASANDANQIDFLNNNGIAINKEISLFSLIRSAKDFVKTENDSLESNKITVDALLNTITTYESNNQNDQLLLFNEQSSSIWENTGTGAAFCDLARSFFSSFTDRYLKYYLDRVASSAINDYNLIESFSNKLSEQIEKHAFETSKIMQSYAAGWFNVHSKDRLPNIDEIKSFLKLTFTKLREEFRREAEK